MMRKEGGQSGPGTLWVVATPIGNLEDLSPRARRALETVPVVAAEDTRVSSRLLDGRAQRPVLISLNEHSESRRIDQLLEHLSNGQDVALVSDAGTPLISDPGYRLVAAVHEAGLEVRTVPGPCAAIAALSIAGLPTDRFWFEGFLPARSGPRRTRLMELFSQTATLIFYVPARDLPAVLEDMMACFGPDRLAAVARELTKLHETVRRDQLQALQEWTASDSDQQKGEAVVLVQGSEETVAATVDAQALAAALAEELPPSRAARLLAQLTGMPRKEAWARIEQIKA